MRRADRAAREREAARAAPVGLLARARAEQKRRRRGGGDGSGGGGGGGDARAEDLRMQRMERGGKDGGDEPLSEEALLRLMPPIYRRALPGEPRAAPFPLRAGPADLSTLGDGGAYLRWLLILAAAAAACALIMTPAMVHYASREYSAHDDVAWCGRRAPRARARARASRRSEAPSPSVSRPRFARAKGGT